MPALQDRARSLELQDALQHLPANRAGAVQQDLARGLQEAGQLRHFVAVAVAAFRVVAFDGQHRQAGGEGGGEVVEGFAVPLGGAESAAAQGVEGAGEACVLMPVAVGVPGVFFGEDQGAEVWEEAEGGCGGEGGDALDDFC